MAWQSYVDDNLMSEYEGHRLTGAAIVGHDGSVWAQSAGFGQYNPQEINGIMNEFNQPGTLESTGLVLGGEEYTVTSGEPGVVIRGRRDSTGVCLMKTNTAVILGTYDESMSSDQADSIVQKLGDYLNNVGY